MTSPTPQKTPFTVSLFVQGLRIALQDAYASARSWKGPTPDAMFFAGVCCLMFSPIAALMFALLQGASTEPPYSALLFVSLAGLPWLCAMPIVTGGPPFSKKDAVLIWLFLPMSPVLYAGFLFMDAQGMGQHVLPLVFFPGSALVVSVLSVRLVRTARRGAHTLVQKAYDRMSAHKRIALMAQTRKQTTDDSA